jgi:hypothetical protein
MDSNRSLAFSKEPLLFGNKLFIHRSDSAVQSRFRGHLKYTNMQTLQLSSNSFQVFIQMLFCRARVHLPNSIISDRHQSNELCMREFNFWQQIDRDVCTNLVWLILCLTRSGWA